LARLEDLYEVFRASNSLESSDKALDGGSAIGMHFVLLVVWTKAWHDLPSLAACVRARLEERGSALRAWLEQGRGLIYARFGCRLLAQVEVQVRGRYALEVLGIEWGGLVKVITKQGARRSYVLEHLRVVNRLLTSSGRSPRQEQVAEGASAGLCNPALLAGMAAHLLELREATTDVLLRAGAHLVVALI